MKKQIGTVVEVPRIATARFIVQMAADAGPLDFEALICTEEGLQQRGEANLRTADSVAELVINVEYGPALGSLEATLLAALRRMAKQCAGITASDVFNYRDRVASKGELDAEIGRLDTASDDITLPLKQRKELSDKANQLRQYVGE